MKNKILILSILFFLPFFAQADFDPNAWRYFKETDVTAADLIQIDLDDDIFGASKKNLADLRVVDEKNQEVPYKLVGKEEVVAQKEYPVNLLNNSFLPGESSSVIVDLSSSGNIIDNLKVLTRSENFRCNARVLGSEDAKNWNVLKDDGYIYDYTDKRGGFSSQETRVFFPASFFRYYKIELSGENLVKIDTVLASQRTENKTRETERRLDFSLSQNGEQKLTQVVIDAGFEGLPLHQLSLKTKNQNFNRTYAVYSSSDKNNWRKITQGYIFQYDTPKFKGDNLKINFLENGDRYIKVEIFNNDDAPIEFSEVVGISGYRGVIFQVKDNQRYRIFYGNAKAAASRYDLEKYFQYLDTKNVRIVKLSAQKENVDFIPEKEPEKPLSERIPFLLPGALLSAIALLLILVYRFFRK